jgi:hypothetical protein
LTETSHREIGRRPKSRGRFQSQRSRIALSELIPAAGSFATCCTGELVEKKYATMFCSSRTDRSIRGILIELCLRRPQRVAFCISGLPTVSHLPSWCFQLDSLSAADRCSDGSSALSVFRTRLNPCRVALPWVIGAGLAGCGVLSAGLELQSRAVARRQPRFVCLPSAAAFAPGSVGRCQQDLECVFTH